MARVRFEIWYDNDHFDSVEVGNSDLHESFERVVRMARAALPPKTEPPLEPGTYSMVVNNVQFDEVNGGLLMGTSVPPHNFQVRVSGNRAAEKGQCQERCPDAGAGHPPHRCERQLGHDGQHMGDDGCAWPSNDPPEQCDQRIHWLGVGYPCIEQEGHEGPCESATGIRWQFGNSIIWCKGRWGLSLTDPLGDGKACRLPEGHEGECGPLPEPESEVADCA